MRVAIKSTADALAHKVCAHCVHAMIYADPSVPVCVALGEPQSRSFVDLVTGEMSLSVSAEGNSCRGMRESGPCGIEGRLFVPAPVKAVA